MLGVGLAPATLQATVLLRPATGDRDFSSISTDSGGTGIYTQVIEGPLLSWN